MAMKSGVDESDALAQLEEHGRAFMRRFMDDSDSDASPTRKMAEEDLPDPAVPSPSRPAAHESERQRPAPSSPPSTSAARDVDDLFTSPAKSSVRQSPAVTPSPNPSAGVKVYDGSGRSRVGKLLRKRAGDESVRGEDDPAKAREEFRLMQQDVLRLGARGLDKKARREFDAATLERIGARRAKAPRTPASLGLGMARKQAQRAEKTAQEAIAAGMLDPRGRGKAHRREEERANPRDGGLMELGDDFRDGVLDLRRKTWRGGRGGRGSGRGRGRS